MPRSHIEINGVRFAIDHDDRGLDARGADEDTQRFIDDLFSDDPRLFFVPQRGMPLPPDVAKRDVYGIVSHMRNAFGRENVTEDYGISLDLDPIPDGAVV